MFFFFLLLLSPQFGVVYSTHSIRIETLSRLEGIAFAMITIWIAISDNELEWQLIQPFHRNFHVYVFAFINFVVFLTHSSKEKKTGKPENVYIIFEEWGWVEKKGDDLSHNRVPSRPTKN